MKKPDRQKQSGFSLVETLVAIALFVIIAGAVYQAYGEILQLIIKNQWRADAVSVLQNEIEAIRDMAYEDVGISGGYPAGKIVSPKTVVMDGNIFTVTSAVRSIDDPFDGTLGGTPNDTAPADYKLVELEATCDSCANFGKVSMTTTVAPKALESASTNGNLFINAIDASGNPVSDANVSVTNNQVTPVISINDRTNNNGVLQLVDVPTSTVAYHISISKAGYSSDQTYPIGGQYNPNPIKPDATVVSQQVTSISFAIDKTGSLNVKTINQMCQPVSSVDFGMTGAKLVGTNPNVPKFSQLFTSDSNGSQSIGSLEWDSYSISANDQQYALLGTIPLLPVSLVPAQNTSLSMIMQPKNPSALLVTVTDMNGNPINDASVEIIKSPYDQTMQTGIRTYSQTDWSGGNYSTQSGNIETETYPGKLELKNNGNGYATSSEWLISNTIDFGANDVVFGNFSWNPTSQPLQAGTESLGFQFASNDDNATWNFTGPDGTANSVYYSPSGINSGISGHRYFRYKVFMKTINQNYTPSLNDISLDFSSSCVPGGQAFFDGLSTGIYTVNVTKNGYQPYANSNVSVSSEWQELKLQLTTL